MSLFHYYHGWGGGFTSQRDPNTAPDTHTPNPFTDDVTCPSTSWIISIFMYFVSLTS